MDLFQSGFIFNFLPSPPNYLRETVSCKLPLEDRIYEFESIYREIKGKYIDEDLKREEELEKRREQLAKLLEDKTQSMTKVKPEQFK